MVLESHPEDRNNHTPPLMVIFLAAVP